MHRYATRQRNEHTAIELFATTPSYSAKNDMVRKYLRRNHYQSIDTFRCNGG
jgi:hypothetical protein